MINKVLVPVDGSDFAEEALPLAIGLARRAEAEIHLARVHIARGLPYYEALSEPDPEEDARIRAEEEAALRRAAERIEAEGVTARVELLDGGITDALAEYIDAAEIDIVVMTTHGRGGLSRAWLGSVADRLVRTSSAPVLLVRPGETKPVEAEGLNEILIPLDGSALSESVLGPATQLAALADARIVLLQVYLYGVPLGQAATMASAGERAPKATTVYLENVAKDLRAAGFEVETIAVTDYMPAPAILDLTAKRGSSLIALATHGRGGLSRIALGSVTDKVMRGAPVPVLVKRAGE